MTSYLIYTIPFVMENSDLDTEKADTPLVIA